MTDHPKAPIMEWKMELVLLPVADVDRAKSFYADTLGFTLDVDHRNDDDTFRVVQLTPPGSACSIGFGIGVTDAAPGSTRGLHLVVADIEAAHTHLVAAGVACGSVTHFVNGQSVEGPDPDRQDYNSFISFADPDGNTWAVQEVRHGKA